MKALRAMGMDGAVTYAFLARLMSVAGSAGTVLLIVRFLSPVEQGYYYTLLSLVSLQVVFELGFSFVIQQLAAHECVHLEFGPNGSVSGESQAHARLASALQLSVRWYSIAAAAMALLLAPLGAVFFSRYAVAGACRLAGPMAGRCARLFRQLMVHAVLLFSRRLRPRTGGGRDALPPGCCRRALCLGAAASSSRALLARPGHCGPDRHRTSLCG